MDYGFLLVMVRDQKRIIATRSMIKAASGNLVMKCGCTILSVGAELMVLIHVSAWQF